MNPNPEFPGDSNVESVKAKMDARAKVGFRKYGVTTERGDLSLLDWLRHAQEEAMDQVVYLEAAIRRLENPPVPTHPVEMLPGPDDERFNHAKFIDTELFKKSESPESFANELFTDTGGNLSSQ